MIKEYFVKKWFKEVMPIILIKDRKTDKTLDMLDLLYFGDRILCSHNGKFKYKSTNGKEREVYLKGVQK